MLIDINQSDKVGATVKRVINFRKTSRGDPALVEALQELVAILRHDPHNRAGRHPIKKLGGLKPGEGQWRIRWRAFRLRYDIFGSDVVLHSFRDRKDAY